MVLHRRRHQRHPGCPARSRARRSDSRAAPAIAAGGTIELEITTADDRNEHPIVCLIAGQNIPTRFSELRAMYRTKELRSANSVRILQGVHTTSFLDVPPGRSTVCVVRHRLDAPGPR